VRAHRDLAVEVAAQVDLVQADLVRAVVQAGAEAEAGSRFDGRRVQTAILASDGEKSVVGTSSVR
jgi:hypothetical protein